jgi:hypothetical protein
MKGKEKWKRWEEENAARRDRTIMHDMKQTSVLGGKVNWEYFLILYVHHYYKLESVTVKRPKFLSYIGKSDQFCSLIIYVLNFIHAEYTEVITLNVRAFYMSSTVTEMLRNINFVTSYSACTAE